MSKHTEGPWIWSVNPASKRIQICGGVPKYDLTVMDFVRWGMGGAIPRFRNMDYPLMNVMKKADEFATICPGREHHSDWFRLLTHPDALLMQAAPDLLAACEDFLRELAGWCDSNTPPTDSTMAELMQRTMLAVEKAKGQ